MTSTTDSGYAILGAGMAGFGAANALHERGIRPRIFDERPSHGGLTSSHNEDGFIFDEGVHISFSKNEGVKELFAKSVDNEFFTDKVYCNNYWKGHWIKHPAQVNLKALPEDMIVACLKDFIEANAVQNPRITNYEEWLLAVFGKTFAETFPMEYTVKYHTTEARNMTTDWLGPRLYRPKLEEVLNGAIKHEPLDVFYVNTFRYPLNGGFVSFLNHFVPMAEVNSGHRVEQIDMQDKSLRFSNGTSTNFEKLISSIPLPRLIPLIKGAPAEVLEAAAKLACSQVVVVNVGINRPFGVKQQWSYFYDRHIPFSRTSFRENLSPNNVPPGCGALQAEIYFSDKYRPLEGRPEDWIEPTIDALIETGLIKDRSEVIHTSTVFIPFGNVIFDLDRPKNLEIVQGYLNEIGIAFCGRFGDWGYIWTDHAFLSGGRAARSQMAGRRQESLEV